MKAEKNADSGKERTFFSIDGILLYILIIVIDEGGIEWRSKDGGLSGGTRQKPLQVSVFCFSFRHYTLALHTAISNTRWK